MVYSDIALKILVAKELGLIKTNAQFHKEFTCREKFEEFVCQNKLIETMTDSCIQRFATGGENEGFICAFDSNFPCINSNVKNSEKPHLLFYKGDISLLADLNKNIAVIGLTDPTQPIEKREIAVVSNLVKNNLTIVSGLAKGCDTIAHKVCVDAGKKTIAILASQISKIYPAANKNLANSIVEKGGLLLSEYYNEPLSRHHAISRFIERDRLQAMFSKAVILIASYRKNEGDSGSRHAMKAAHTYGIERYVMYNEEMDIDNLQFGLNQDFVNFSYPCVKILNKASIGKIVALNNPLLVCDSSYAKSVQLQLL